MPLHVSKNGPPMNFDLRSAINAVSDVVANRPQPLREFDQIYMKVADMVIQAHIIAERMDGMDVVFVGDGDSIGLSIMHLKKEGIFKKAPNRIHLLDFDERIVKAVKRFAEKHGIDASMTAELYNVADSLPNACFQKFNAFYTNPPWGSRNEGESVKVFLERGMEATGEQALGVMVIADDPKMRWTQEVLRASQLSALNMGFVVGEMIPELHLYHLEDNPKLRSCTCIFRRLASTKMAKESLPLDEERKKNFYGNDSPLEVRYVRERDSLNYGKAPDGTYELERMEKTDVKDS